MTGNLAHSHVNDQRYADLEKTVKSLGTEHAKGADSWSKLGMAILEAAANDVITGDRDTDGNDDCTRLYEVFLNQASKRVYADRSKGSNKVQISKLRQFRELGANTKVDGVNLMADAVKVHKELAAAGEKVKPSFNMMVDICRAQKRQDDLLSADQIRTLCVTGESKERTAESVLKSAHKLIERLITGEAGVPFDCDDDTKNVVISVEESLRGVLATFAKAGAVAKAQAELDAALAAARSLGLAA